MTQLTPDVTSRLVDAAQVCGELSGWKNESRTLQGSDAVQKNPEFHSRNYNLD